MKIPFLNSERSEPSKKKRPSPMTPHNEAKAKMTQGSDYTHQRTSYKHPLPQDLTDRIKEDRTRMDDVIRTCSSLGSRMRSSSSQLLGDAIRARRPYESLFSRVDYAIQPFSYGGYSDYHTPTQGTAYNYGSVYNNQSADINKVWMMCENLSNQIVNFITPQENDSVYLSVENPDLSPVFHEILKKMEVRLNNLIRSASFGFYEALKSNVFDHITKGNSCGILNTRLDGMLQYRALSLKRAYCFSDTLTSEIIFTAYFNSYGYGTSSGQNIITQKQVIKEVQEGESRDLEAVTDSKTGLPLFEVSEFKHSSMQEISSRRTTTPPLIFSRSRVTPGEHYGLGRAVVGINDIERLNIMKDALMESAHLQARPVQIISTGIVSADVRVYEKAGPGSIIKGHMIDGTSPIQNVEPSIDLKPLMALYENIENSLQELFLKDLGVLPENGGMSVEEVAERADMKVPILSPEVARLQEELVLPVLRGTLAHLIETAVASGEISLPREGINISTAKITFNTRFDEVRKLKLFNLTRGMLLALAETSKFLPDIGQHLDQSAVIESMLDYSGLSPHLFVSPEDNEDETTSSDIKEALGRSE